MIKETSSGQLLCNLTWTKEGQIAIDTIEQKLQVAPASTARLIKEFSVWLSPCLFVAFTWEKSCLSHPCSAYNRHMDKFVTPYSDPPDQR